MMESLLFKELGIKVSPLAKLAKEYQMLPERTLNQSIEKVREELRVPRKDGKWSGEPGNSIWHPDRDVIPKDRNHSNESNKTWGKILDEHGIDGITFVDGEPIFSEISKGTVEIKEFTDVRFGAGGNFDQADEALAKRKGCTVEDVRQWRSENNYTWHERGDCKTMDKVSREIHHNVSHSGGISKIKRKI